MNLALLVFVFICFFHHKGPMSKDFCEKQPHLDGTSHYTFKDPDSIECLLFIDIVIVIVIVIVVVVVVVVVIVI